MRHVDYLLIGGGVASVSAARTLRGEDAAASIAILCGEAVAPYQRPPLTKRFLSGKVSARQLSIQDIASYATQRIDVVLGARATSVDPAARIVALADGDAIHYNRLLIATGAAPRLPDLPGIQLAGIHCLHRLDEAQAIREAAATARHVVVLGAGFVGIETAASLRTCGLDVTLLEREDRILPALHASALSGYFTKLCADNGIVVRTDCREPQMIGTHHVEAVRIADDETIPCDLLIVAVGVTPNCAFLEGSGLPMGDGVQVDEFLQTADPYIFAAGDVANFSDPIFGVRRRIEHWDNAVRQGKLAARNMLGHRFPYRDVSIFYGDMFGVSYNFLGYDEGATETVERGTIDGHSYALLYLKNDILRAAFAVNHLAGDIASLSESIRLRVNLHADRARLSDPGVPLNRLPVQTSLILQGGGALGAFECGAIKALAEQGVRPDVIAAVSIGAFNGAIAASHPDDAASALAAFWQELSIPTPPLGSESLQQAWISWYVLWYGVPNFLRPCWWAPAGLFDWQPSSTSYYDSTPILQLVERYVDFDALAASPTRLLLSVVDVTTGEPRIFDSYVHRLSARHLLASGSLPPGMPWTMIDGRPYWDGGIVSNSPLDLIVDRCGRVGGRVYIVDLFSGERPMPGNLVEVMLRREEIAYMDRIRNDLRFEEYASDFSDLIGGILEHVDAATASRIRQRPLYIRLMGSQAPLRISRISLNRTGPLSFAGDYDFSTVAVSRLQEQGYQTAMAVLDQESSA